MQVCICVFVCVCACARRGYDQVEIGFHLVMEILLLVVVVVFFFNVCVAATIR